MALSVYERSKWLGNKPGEVVRSAVAIRSLGVQVAHSATLLPGAKTIAIQVNGPRSDDFCNANVSQSGGQYLTMLSPYLLFMIGCAFDTEIASEKSD